MYRWASFCAVSSRVCAAQSLPLLKSFNRKTWGSSCSRGPKQHPPSQILNSSHHSPLQKGGLSLCMDTQKFPGSLPLKHPCNELGSLLSRSPKCNKSSPLQTGLFSNEWNQFSFRVHFYFFNFRCNGLRPRLRNHLSPQLGSLVFVSFRAQYSILQSWA